MPGKLVGTVTPATLDAPIFESATRMAAAAIF